MPEKPPSPYAPLSQYLLINSTMRGFQAEIAIKKRIT